MDNLKYNYRLLKEKREAKNISLADMAFMLCLAERQIHSIENNLPDYFYSPAIKLACIKKYADKLDLDVSVVLNQLEEVSPPHEVKSPEASSHDAIDLNEVIIKRDKKITEPANKKTNTPQPKSDQSTHDVIHLTTAYIQQNLANKISITDLKKISGYSERSIQLVYKKHFNMTPFEYIEEQRLMMAKRLIEQHKASKKISDVAVDAGFTHLGRFSISFKKRFGISPSLLVRS